MFQSRLHHVGLVVPHEDQVEMLISLLGLKRGRSEYVDKYQANCIFTEGEAGVIEFIIPTGGALASFNKGMGGIHHIALEVDSLDEVAAELGDQHVPLLELMPVDAGPLLINFLSPLETRGIIVEFVQKRPDTEAT